MDVTNDGFIGRSQSAHFHSFPHDVRMFLKPTWSSRRLQEHCALLFRPLDDRQDMVLELGPDAEFPIGIHQPFWYPMRLVSENNTIAGDIDVFFLFFGVLLTQHYRADTMPPSFFKLLLLLMDIPSVFLELSPHSP